MKKKVTFPSDKCCFGATVIRGKGWSKDRGGRRRGSLFLPAILEVGFNHPPEAELSPDLSRDRRVITTRWINTGVVKVKWCYVARCYWTRPVKIHDTDTFSRSSSGPRFRLRPGRDPRRGSSVEALLSTVSRAGCSSLPLSLTQSSRLSDTRRELRCSSQFKTAKSCGSYYHTSLFNLTATQHLQIKNKWWVR